MTPRTPRTPRQQLQQLMGCMFLVNVPLLFFHPWRQGPSGWFDYAGAVLLLVAGVMFLVMGLGRKERP